MASISEELKKRMDERPDVYTLQWWQSQLDEVKKGYSGACHAMNKVSAENEDISKLNAELQSRLEAQNEDRKADRAKIGELQSRVDRMADFLGKMRNGGKGDGQAKKAITVRDAEAEVPNGVRGEEAKAPENHAT